MEKDANTLPEEPQPVTTGADNDIMSGVEKMKYKAKYDRYLNRVDKVEMQLKQTYSKYYGQCDEDMKASLKEDSDFVRSHQEKDIVKLRKMLKNINFNYKKSEEPIKHYGKPTKTSSTCANIKWTSRNTSRNLKLFIR